MTDRASFAASAPFRSSLRKGVGRSSSVMMDADAERTLQSMGLSRKTRAQDAMDDLFRQGEKPARREPGKPARPGGPKGTRARRW
jgi:hypothetical protein